MTQDERWQKRYNEVIDFIETNKRNPSKHRIEEHDMLEEDRGDGYVSRIIGVSNNQ